MIAESELAYDQALRIDCPVLITERLVMRRPHLDDVPDLVELAGNRRIAEMVARVPHPYGTPAAESFVAMSVHPQRAGCVYAMTIAETGAFVGCAGLDVIEGGGLELGYWVGEPYWGKGYATEAAHALVDQAFRATLVPALDVSCRVINPASRRVIHKCGFQYSGQGMMHSLAVGPVPVERYRLDRKTWIGLRSWPRT